MNLFSLSGLLIGLACTAMAIWVFFNNPSSRINQVWSVLCVSVAFWGFGGLAIGLAPTAEASLLSWRIAYIGVSFIPSLFYHFVTLFLELRRSRQIIIAYTASTFHLLLSSTDLFFSGVKFAFGEFYYSIAGPFNLSFLLFFLLMVILSHIEMTRFLSRNQNKHKATQVKWLFVATALGFTGGSTCFLPSFGIDLYPYGNITVFLYPIIVSYAIVRHQLMDIRVVIQKTLFYSVLTITVSILYLSFVYILHAVLLTKGAHAPEFINFIGILFVALTFKPIEVLIHRLLERRFFKGTISEISAQKELLETELERRERLKSVGIMAAGMAHEVKNPITIIQTFVEYLPKKYDDSEFREKFVRIVTQEVGRIKTIVSDLLIFSKPSEPIKTLFEIDRVLKALAEIISGEAMRAGVKVECRIKSATVYADADQIKQALLNILMNAIEAMRSKGGSLIIETHQAADAIEIVIKDTGPGIPKDKLTHIFDPFFTTKEQGTGLGLSITHSIIEKNAGTITARSEEGVGTEFHVSLPLKSSSR